MDITEFRESYINEDINAEAVITSRYPIEVFIDSAVDILQNDYSLIGGMNHCYFERSRGSKPIRIDAAYLDLPLNTLNLLFADFNANETGSITNSFIAQKSKQLLNFIEYALKGNLKNAELADPAVQIANDIVNNISSIGKIHLFIVSTDKLSASVKTLKLDDFVYAGTRIPVVLDVLDIEKIFRAKLVGFQKEALVIECREYGVEGIPCIKADIETDQYESYLAIVPGKFLADIYKKHSATLLESNVRAFLKFNGGVNKGIRGTILNEKSRFFTYNNGISTTASKVSVERAANGGLVITSFTDLQIINGGQTTATLAATSIKNHADLSGIFVQMKLTVLKNADPDLIRNIATYANSQNKVKTADLNSGHPFYVRIEDFSRKIYAPLASGHIVQQLWFFERVRGQYEQPIMQMTKKQRDDYKLVRPKAKKFSLTDLAKYMNAADMLPHYVSWGGEVNAAHFHNNMLKQWEKNPNVFNELYYKELIGKKILFEHIGDVISDQLWYQERRAYRPQLIAYTFAKLVLEIKRVQMRLDYQKIWDYQSVPDCLDSDIARISKVVFDKIYDENRPTANIETYCKRAECWDTIEKIPYTISEQVYAAIISPKDHSVEQAQAIKEQKLDASMQSEIGIFEKGDQYWRSLLERGSSQEVLDYVDIKALENAIKYCTMEYTELSIKQVKSIIMVVKKLADNGIQ